MPFIDLKCFNPGFGGNLHKSKFTCTLSKCSKGEETKCASPKRNPNMSIKIHLWAHTALVDRRGSCVDPLPPKVLGVVPESHDLGGRGPGEAGDHAAGTGTWCKRRGKWCCLCRFVSPHKSPPPPTLWKYGKLKEKNTSRIKHALRVSQCCAIIHHREKSIISEGGYHFPSASFGRVARHLFPVCTVLWGGGARIPPKSGREAYGQLVPQCGESASGSAKIQENMKYLQFGGWKNLGHETFTILLYSIEKNATSGNNNTPQKKTLLYFGPFKNTFALKMINHRGLGKKAILSETD